VEIVKAQALEINEKMESKHKEFLKLLSNIQADRDDKLRLQDMMMEIHGRH
jgi:hypothetical protein